ncbi:MAG: glutamate mutase L, partial [Firmicutes bacterium]|nr:glutamate mutase L [Bacillota bacterium]
SAMMQAMQLLAEGCENPDGSKETGIGDLLAVDVGGATTDIYSVCDGMPRAGMDTIFKGLPEPYIKRTVEGDIGMRYSIHGIEEAVGTGYISQLSGLPEERCREMIDYLGKNTEVVPTDAESEALDFALASGAIKTAVTRHAGRLEEFYTMNGIAYMQTGKDLREIRQIIVTGGSLIHTKRTGKIASAAFWDPQDPFSLKPKQADIWVDRSYILAAMGLLSGYYPGTALRIMKKELKKDGYQE